MANLIGTYDCKVDGKSRVVLPSGLKKQLSEVLSSGFVLNYDMNEPCLVLYTKKEFDELSKVFNEMDNPFDNRQKAVKRKFYMGASPVDLDSAGRILIPAHLKTYAGISNQVRVIAQGPSIEIWSPEKLTAAFGDTDGLNEQGLQLFEDAKSRPNPDE